MQFTIRLISLHDYIEGHLKALLFCIAYIIAFQFNICFWRKNLQPLLPCIDRRVKRWCIESNVMYAVNYQAAFEIIESRCYIYHTDYERTTPRNPSCECPKRKFNTNYLLMIIQRISNASRLEWWTRNKYSFSLQSHYTHAYWVYRIQYKFLSLYFSFYFYQFSFRFVLFFLINIYRLTYIIYIHFRM